MLTTLPVAIMVVGVATSTLPATFLRRRIGRKPGFIGASLLAAVAALLAAYAVQLSSFTLLCLGTFFVWTQGAFVQQYRFAATESVEPIQTGRGVSFVLLGGIVAAFLGPEIAVRSSDWVPGTQYMGSFLAMASLYALTALDLVFYKGQRKAVIQAAEIGHPLGEIASQPPTA